MTVLKGKGIFGGRAKGSALVTRMPMNVTASFTKVKNVLPGYRSQVMDRHHDLFKQDVKGRVLVFPTLIGSTYSGMVLLQTMYEGVAPAAMIVQNADPLLVSGTVLAEVWFNKGVPVVQVDTNELFEKIKTGDLVEVDGETGEVQVRSKP